MKKVFTLFSLIVLFTCNLNASEFGSILSISTLFSLTLLAIYLLTIKIKSLTKEANRFHSLFNASQSVVMLVEMESGRILESNIALSKLLNLKQTQIKNRIWFERFVPAESSIIVRHILKKQFKSNDFFPFEMSLITQDNITKQLRFQVTRIPSQENIYLLNGTDISEERALKSKNTHLLQDVKFLKLQLDEQEEHFYSTFEMSINGVAIVNEKGEVHYSNSRLQTMLDYNAEHFQHRGLQILFENEESLSSILVTAKTEKRIENMHLVTRKRSGEALDIDFSISYMEKSKEYFVIIQDISQTVARAHQLKIEMASYAKKAKHDALTTIYNRAHLDTTLETLYQEQAAYSFILFDIDHFKAINDTYGHLVGDDVLKKLSSIVKDKVRSNDIFARYGGEEFGIVLKGTSLEDSKMLAEKIRMLIFTFEFKTIKTLTCSFGLSTSNPNETPRDVIARADEALYLAKEGGRNRVITL